MKLHISNLGAIKSADIALSDLTVIIGNNNSGKTYITYSLYGVLDSLRVGGEAFVQRYLLLASVEKEEYFDGKIVILFNIDKYINTVGSLNGFANKGSDFLQRIFNDSKGDLVKDLTRVEPFFDKNDILIRRRDGSKDDPISKAKVKILVKKNIATIVVDLKNLDGVKPRVDNLISFFSENFVIDFRLIPYIFTAERLGIALFYKELDATRASIFQELQSNSRNIDLAQIMRRSSAYYAVPIKRNIDFTRSIDTLAVKPKNSFNRYALRLISQLAGGEYAQNSSDEIRFHNPESESIFNIPLYLASSSVRALSDLYFYLSYEARPGHVLIIDEPESHLTIEKQRIMARLLAAIVNAKIKVVITTHSDFLLRELNNLIKLSNNFPNKSSFFDLTDGFYTESDFLSPEKVVVYQVIDGFVRQIEVSSFGISGTPFDDSIAKSNTASSLLESFLYA